MPTPTHRPVRRSFRAVLLRGLIPVLAGYLPRQRLLARPSWATIYTPPAVVWASVVQALDRHASDRAASYRVGEWLGVPVNGRSGALCKARQRLPVEWLQALAADVAEACWTDARRGPRGLKGRRILILDASSLTVADTPQNRAAFGLPSGVTPGCGYPVLKLAVLMDSRSGAVVAWSSGDVNASEFALAQPLLAHLRPGDVVVADAWYGSYSFLAQLRALGVDLVARQAVGRKNQRPGRRHDWDEVWSRPRQLNPLHAAACGPPSQTVRCVWIERRERETIKLLTSLPREQVSAREVGRLFEGRWRIETQLGQLKTVQGADFLAAAKPDTVAWAVGAHLLALNLLCAWRCEVAREQRREPWRLSLTGLRDGLLSLVGRAGPVSEQRAWLLACARGEGVPERPGRNEPRRVKRRPKEYPWMTRPRDVLRAELVGGR